jgi:hypothetical protein
LPVLGAGLTWSINGGANAGSFAITSIGSNQSLCLASGLNTLATGASLAVHITGTTVPVGGPTFMQTMSNTATVDASNETDHNQQSSATVTVLDPLATPTPPTKPLPTTPPPFVSVAFGHHGAVMELVNSQGLLTQFDALGAHVLAGGVRSASVAFDRSGQEVVLITFLDGTLELLDSHGAHVLGSGTLSAAVAFGPFGEVIEAVLQDGQLLQFDTHGVNLLSVGVRSAGVAFDHSGKEVLLITFQNGTLERSSAGRALVLGNGVQSAGVAFSPAGEVLDVIFTDGTLEQFDAFGAHELGKLF